MSKGRHKYYGYTLIEAVEELKKKMKEERGIELTDREASDLMGRNVDLDELYMKILG